VSEHKVIGYAANCGKNRFFAHGGAMLITGDMDTIQACIISRFQKKSAPARYEYRKIRYRDIETSLARGISFTLDETAYNRFAAVAIELGRKIAYPFPEELKSQAHGLPVIKLKPKPPPAGTSAR